MTAPMCTPRSRCMLMRFPSPSLRVLYAPGMRLSAATGIVPAGRTKGALDHARTASPHRDRGGECFDFSQLLSKVSCMCEYIPDQKNADGRLSAVAAEASTWSWNRSFCARRRSTAGSTWSMRYRNRLLRRFAALRARFLRCVLSPHARKQKLASACVSQRS